MRDRQQGALRGGQGSVMVAPAPVFSFTEAVLRQAPPSVERRGSNRSIASATTCASIATFSTAAHRPNGLVNVGNTCYANAVLQCLLSTALPQALLDPKASAIFRRYSSNSNLLELAKSKDDDQHLRDKCKWLTRELKKITVEYSAAKEEEKSWLQMLSWAQGPVIDPGSITRHPERLCPCLRPYSQEDAHEFLRALLSTLVMNGQNKQLSSLFDGLLESSVTCQCCQRPSLTRDRYMDLSLDIHQPHIHSLTQALADFTAEETLGDDNAVFCKHCAVKQTATKALRLATAPSILVCHLKRFAMDEYGRLERVHKHVQFPERLQIDSYMSKVNKSRPPAYDLVSLLVHQGSTCDSGHYIAFCKHAGEWYQCNDSVVEKVSFQTVLRQQAYILVYEVAEMREKHGYPSPNSRRRRRTTRRSASQTAESFFMSGLCGLDDSLLRDVCCYDTTNSLFAARDTPTTRGAARDDSTLETVESQSRGLRRSNSSVTSIRGRKSRGRKGKRRSSSMMTKARY